ncbi:hypothetical protein CAG63_18390 [Vibrio sp. V37_P2S8PM304]|uniref:hypothetical protein n=1 Tax=Vibrio sp. V37_P2S8PM304 TaxID=1938688 RepID=UPI0013723846|nr:hypothetical protein [Vibrio sp. V37_P2S8PM304]NAX32017.1 hypothetical protein [Vibrio sp. V37_P2S8PM304]
MTDKNLAFHLVKPANFREVQRWQKRSIQSATADLLASAVLIEKALDSNLDDEAHALVNAAYFQINQVRETFDQLAMQIDNIQLEEKPRE